MGSNLGAREKAELWDRWPRGSSALQPATAGSRECSDDNAQTARLPAVASETLDLAQCFPSRQGAPFFGKGQIATENRNGEKP